MGFREWLADWRAKREALMRSQRARIEAEAAERLREAERKRRIREGDALVREAERKRVAELSARGGVPLKDESEFTVVPDVEATYQAQRMGHADQMRYRQVNGPRRDLTGAELPRIDMEATAVARLTNPNATAVYYWPARRSG